MNLNCPNDVLKYPITKKELAHSSRSRIGYHVFLSHFFFDFYSLSGAEKGDVLATSNVWEDADAQSCDSVLTPRTPAVSEVMRAASWHWRSMPLILKSSWGVRATQLNRRPRNDGTFLNVPSSIMSDTLPNSITHSLSLEWKYFLSIFMNATIYISINSCISKKKQYRFGNEVVILRNEKYRNMYLSHLLKLTLFGFPLFSNLKQSETIYRSKKICIIHILSYNRINELFSFGGRSLGNHVRNDVEFIMCGSVNLLKGGKEISGMIINESENELMIMIENESSTMVKITVPRPTYDGLCGKYRFHNNPNYEYQLVEVSPLRIKINQSGKASTIFHHFSLNKNLTVEALKIF